jgi:flap endonuclease-1
MGVNISEIIPKKEIQISALNGKTVAVDAFNTLYQFLTTIRQSDGTPLMDSKGRTTSHLSGLFYRNLNLMKEGLKLVYVFDGKPPEMKMAEIARRKEAKEQAREKFEEAKQKEDIDSMRKYAGRDVKITQEIINESKELLVAMGIPVIQAVGEGEAEASYLARGRKVWASASQDFDSILYGTPILIRNLTLSRKRKTSSGLYVDVNPEIIELQDVLNKLNISLSQLICLAILVGTDYNPGGVKGLGQKRALEIVSKFESPVEIFDFVKKSEKYTLDFNWQGIYKIFNEYGGELRQNIKFPEADKEKIKNLLKDFEFSETRIENGLEKLEKIKESQKQRGLKDFF